MPLDPRADHVERHGGHVAAVEHRMRVAGVNVRYEDALNADVYRNSQTILKDPLLGDYVANREYYLRKWGGLPGEENYKTPFNQ